MSCAVTGQLESANTATLHRYMLIFYNTDILCQTI